MANKHNIGFIVDDNKVIKKVIDYSIIKIDDEEKSESFAAQYILKNSEGDTLGVSIDIPKDKVVENAELKTVEEEDVPYPGAHIGDKYIDITFENHETHVYIPVQDLVDIYYGDEETVHVENHIISSSIWERGTDGESIQIKDKRNYTAATEAVNIGTECSIDIDSTTSTAEGVNNVLVGSHASHVEGCKHNMFGAYSHSEGFGGQKLSVTVFDASTNKYRIEFDNSAVKTSANTVLTIGSMLVNGTSQTVGISDVIRITNIEYDNGYVYTTDTTLDLTNDIYMAEGVTSVASHSEGISNTVHSVGSHAEGISNFVVSSNGSHVSGISNVINSTGRSDAIIAGTYNSITGTAENTVVIGGHNIVGTESNTVYVPSLAISNTTDDKEVKLTVDSEGFLTVNVNGTSYYVSLSTEKPGEDVLTPAEVSEIYDNTQPNDND